MRIPQHTIQTIREAADIVEVISDYVSLKKKGANWWALSPFTQEKTPSFSVAPNKGIFKCFSTGKGGDVITFLMEIENISYVEALKTLAKRYGIKLEYEETPTDEQLQQQNEKESLLIALEFATQYFQRNLQYHTEGKVLGLSYFKERGFHRQTMETFQLGYSLKAWNAFTEHALQQGFSLEILEKAGLTIIKDEGEKKYYDRFRERVIFPIHNLSGKVIAFGARILGKDAKQAKYLNSPETAVYHKSDILYGIAQARASIRQEENCYLVEGYTDVLSLHQEGIKNVVASSGTSLTENQVRLLKRFTQKVTLLYDGDKAGIKAALRGVDIALEAGLDIRAVLLPDGEDPDSYARKFGGEVLRQFLQENAQDLISFKISLFAQETAQDPLKRAETIREIMQSIAKIPDMVQKGLFIRQLSENMRIEEDTLWIEHNQLIAKQLQQKNNSQTTENSPSTEQNLPSKEEAERSEQEQDLLFFSPLHFSERENVRLLLQYAHHEIAEELKLCEYLLQEIEELHFENETYQAMLALYREALEKGEILDLQFFLAHENEIFRKTAADLAIERYEISENWEKKFGLYIPRDKDMLDILAFKAILRVKQRHIRKQYQETIKKLSKTIEIEAQEILLQELQDLKETEKEIAQLLGNVITKY